MMTAEAEPGPSRRAVLSGEAERADIVEMGTCLRQDLAATGLANHDVDRATFRDAPKVPFGDVAWMGLETAGGQFA